MKNDLVCKNRAAALSSLDTMAAGMPQGMQRAALLAVKAWIEDNTQPSQSREEVNALLAKLFERTPGEQKGQDWHNRMIAGEAAEPEDGAEWKCAYNARKGQWFPISTPPLMR
jgi:hypothetical protein